MRVVAAAGDIQSGGTMRARAILLLFGLVAPAAGQETRLNIFDPAVVLRTGGRTAACDALHFTPAGETLLAVGDDKCVHTWDVRGDDLRYAAPAWGNSYRERRGAMYALAVLPDGQLALAAGLGRLVSDVTVFHLPSRSIRFALSAATHPGYAGAGGSVWAVALAPDRPRAAVGLDDGSVYLWDYETPPKDAGAVRLLAPPAGGDPFAARVVGVGFGPGGSVWFARRGGDVFVADADDAPKKRFAFARGTVQQVVMTPDRAKLIARPAGLRSINTPAGPRLGSHVEVRGLADGRPLGEIEFPGTELPESLAVDHAGRRLAVGVKALDAPGGEKVFREAAGRLGLYDIAGDTPKLTAERSFGTAADDPVRTYPEGVAFHPDGRRVAVAAGWDHETSLWAIDGATLKPLAVSAGVGKCLWQVRASPDGMRLSFRDAAKPYPDGPNDRGDGPWRTFDLKTRTWARGVAPDANGPLETANGWRVVPDPVNPHRWDVTDGKARHPLPIDPLRDFAPICYTFLPSVANDPAAKLAVGHYWGYSLFELRPDAPPRRVRKGTGHNGYVSSVVPANGGKWLITTSRDQTANVWSVEPWADQPELGATFDDVGASEFKVRAVDAGSPAWEAGLIPGDKVRRLARAGTHLEPIDWADALVSPTPGEELAFEVWRFEGQKAPIIRKTQVLQRPIWRFLPTAGKDWVLYRYQDYVYDAGGNGDSYVGWLLGDPNPAMTPEFIPAERYRAKFLRPAEVGAFLAKNSREPTPFFRELVPPPAVAAKASADVVPAAGVSIDIAVTPARGAGGVLPVDKVELWLGDDGNLDSLLREWPGGKDALKLRATVKPEELRVGANRLVVVAHSHARAETPLTVTVKAAAARPGVLRGLVVGVNKYQQIGVPDLSASVDDAKLAAEVLARVGRERPFERADVKTLLDDEATPAAILAELDRVAAAATPDDWFVLFLAGHGFALRGPPPGRIDGDGPLLPGSWLFAGYAPDKASGYAVPAAEVFARLKRARCRKLILLDSCHAGAVGADGGRDLRPEDKGPVVLAAAAPDEEAAEGVTEVTVGGRTVRGRHGFFTASLANGLAGGVEAADRNKDGLLTVDELYEYTRAAVARLRPDQTVQMIPFPLRNLPLVGRAE
jgi:WD40 repeat protein/uncharacterized caspase-like protein